MRSAAADRAADSLLGGIAVISVSCTFSDKDTPHFSSRLKHQHLILDDAAIAKPAQDKMRVVLALSLGLGSRLRSSASASEPICCFRGCACVALSAKSR